MKQIILTGVPLERPPKLLETRGVGAIDFNHAQKVYSFSQQDGKLPSPKSKMLLGMPAFSQSWLQHGQLKSKIHPFPCLRFLNLVWNILLPLTLIDFYLLLSSHPLLLAN